MKLSLCMIVKNEEDTISRCLNSVKEAFDEIIIVDTGSTDRTKEIASHFTDKIYDFKWVDDFSKARNFSFSFATGDYIMWLDADDIMTHDNLQKLISLKEKLDGSIDVVMANYLVAFDEENSPTFSYYRERIVKNNGKFVWVSPIHEVIKTSGNIVYSDFSIEHRKIHKNEKGRNLKIFNKMIENGTKLDTRQKYYYARELYYNDQYTKAIDILEEIIDLNDTWIEDRIGACEMLYLCYLKDKKTNKALESLFKSFKFDKPRAKICCLVANYFLDLKQFDTAIFWYTLAKESNYPHNFQGFVEKDYFDFIPYINLCVCYYNLGLYDKAREFNELAGKIKPNDKSYLSNKDFFNKI